MLLLQPTSPFRSAATIRKAVQLFKKSGGASVVSVSPAQEHPYWSYRVEKGVLKPFFAAKPTRRQELPPAFALNGSIYAASLKTLSLRRSLRSAKTVALLAPENETLDIDTIDDWKEAEKILAASLPQTSKRCTIIAEAGVNHNGDLYIAKPEASDADAVVPDLQDETWSASRPVGRLSKKPPSRTRDRKNDRTPGAVGPIIARSLNTAARSASRFVFRRSLGRHVTLGWVVQASGEITPERSCSTWRARANR